MMRTKSQGGDVALVVMHAKVADASAARCTPSRRIIIVVADGWILGSILLSRR
jgi:hypothetical protein